MANPIYFSVREVADQMKLTKVDAVLKLIHAGDLPAVRVSADKRPTWRIAPADLERFLADRRAVPVRAARRTRRTKSPAVTKYF